jgi:hypothetical protein
VDLSGIALAVTDAIIEAAKGEQAKFSPDARKISKPSSNREPSRWFPCTLFLLVAASDRRILDN